MTSVGKIITLLIFGSLFLAAITHAPGFSMAAMAGTNALDNTLLVESGAGRTGGTIGSATFAQGGSASVG